MKNYEQLYTIQELSEKLSIPKPTLRFWEKELSGLILPFRTPGGQRRYTNEDCQLVEHIAELRINGMSIADIRRALEKQSEPKDRVTIPADMDDLVEKIAGIVKKEVRQYLALKVGLD